MTLASQARQKHPGVREAVHSREAHHYKEPCCHHWPEIISLQLELSALKLCFGIGNVFQSTLHVPQSDISPALRKMPRCGGVDGTACISSNEEAEAGGSWVQGHPQLLTKRLQKLDKDNDEKRCWHSRWPHMWALSIVTGRNVAPQEIPFTLWSLREEDTHTEQNHLQRGFLIFFPHVLFLVISWFSACPLPGFLSKESCSRWPSERSFLGKWTLYQE